MGYALRVELEMRELKCGECGIDFAAPEYLMAKRMEDGKTWYCINGHPRVYRESTSDKLRKELEQERQKTAMERQLRIDTETRLVKEQRAHTRQTKRIAAGVCPCCNRTFQNLARHMKTKHDEVIK